MKKNAMLKIAAILMVAVLLTTCAISSTFAKYVTAENAVASNKATVAKWGLTITGDSDEKIGLFMNSYGTTVDGATDDAILVAPGTTNSSDAFKITVTGTPEVSYKLIVKANLALTGWMPDGYYCPLVFDVDGTKISGLNYANAAAFELAVENEIAKAILGASVDVDDAGNYTYTYAPNTPAPATAANGVAVSWEWAFENATGTEMNQDNAKDTLLGNAADSTVEISFSVSAEQVD